MTDKTNDTKTVHYVRNKDLIPEIEDFNNTGQISEKLGGMLLLIAKNLSNKANFVNYTWKDDMIQEAVFTCCKYLKNFDLEKSKNPFSYITTICNHAFVNYINKQKRHSSVKDALFHNRHDMQEGFGTYQTRAIDYTVMSSNNKKEKKLK